MSEKFSCYIIGEKSLLVKCSEVLLQRGHNIFGIVSSNPTIKQWAAEKDIQTLELNKSLPDCLKEKPYDYLFSITNLSVLPDGVINTPRKSAINFHDGPLPRYAGLNATSWAILNREKAHGVTWHEISSEIDKGGILKQAVFDVDEMETSLSLNAKCFEAGLSSFSTLVQELANGGAKVTHQLSDKRSYYGKYQRPAQAAAIDWRRSAEEISALVKALDFGPYSNPLGLPKIKAGDEYFVIRELAVTDMPSTETAGTIIAIDEERIRVATGTNDVEISRGASIDGVPLSIAGLMYTYSLKPGIRFDRPADEDAQEIDKLNAGIAGSEGYWVNQLSALTFVDLHYAKKKFAFKKKLEFKSVPIHIPGAVLSAFKKFDGDLRISLSAAFGIFIGRHCGINDFHVGFSHAALMAEIGRHVGLFSEYVPLRVSIDPEAGFEDVLKALCVSIESTVQNKTYALDVWGRYAELGQNNGNGGLSVSPVNIVMTDDGESHKAQSRSVLTLAVSRDPDACRCIFDPKAIAEQDVKRFVAQFISFLEDATGDLDRKVAGLSILSPDEKNRLFEEWNNTEVEFPSEKCIHQLFEEQAARVPETTAIVYRGLSHAYGQLNERCNQMARRLRNAGVETETLVGVYLHRSLDMFVAVMGILKAGGAYVPLDPSFPKDRISYMIENSECSVIITNKDLKDELGPVDADLISIDTEWDDIAKETSTNLDCNVAPHNLSYVIYTSGSTGKPKGVMIEHRNVVNFFTGIDGCGAYDPDSIWLAVTTLSFDISVLELLWTTARGFTVVIYTGVEGREDSGEGGSGVSEKPADISIPELIKRHKVTHLQCTPSMASMLMLDEETKSAFGQLKKLLIGGEAFPAALAEQLQEVVSGDIINMYGPTETTVWSTTYKLDKIRRVIPIGRPIANTTIYILDQNLQPVPLGVPGELMIGGEGVVRGYLKQPDLTAERFIKNPFSQNPESRLYRTGDLARYFPDGNIEFIGRMDHQVKIRGYRIELGEIEAVLNKHPALHESVVIAREDVPGQKRLVAYVIPVKGANPTSNQLRDYAKTQLPDYMVPVHVVALDAFPQTPNKKIDRKALPAPSMDRIERGVDFDPPRTDIEEALAGLWADVLGVQQVGRDENFFDIGGESLTATLIILSIKQACNIDLPLHTLFTSPTVAALSKKLEDAFLQLIETEGPGAASAEGFPSTDSVLTDTAPAPVREEIPFEAPVSRTEKSLAAIWAKVLRVNRVGRKDHFFYLGGKSIDAVRMFAEIEKTLGSRMPLSMLLKAPTLEQLATILEEEAWEQSWSPLVPIKPAGSKIPFFCIHAHRGNVLNYYPLANYLGREQPFYGLQARGLDGRKIESRSFTDMASDYMDEIKTVQPHGPYQIGGWCMGGYIALEMAHLLMKAGEKVALVALIDTPNPEYPRFLAGTTIIHRLLYRLRERFDYESMVLRGLEPEKRASHLLRKIKTPLPPVLAFVERQLEKPLSRIRLKIVHSQVYKLHRLYQMHNKALKTYKPRPYPGRTAIFRASQQPIGIHSDPTLGWGGLLSSEVDLREVPGNYINLWIKPSVRLLAGELKECLL